ncbi:MAG: hypothetical protein ACK5PF_05725 [bacterium]|jgi:hypothetical protein
MATSGVTTWKLNRDEVINAALRKLSVLSGGSVPEAYQITQASQALNAMLKAFHADGMPLWALKEFTFNTVANTSAYNIGNSQTLNTPMPLKITQAVKASGSSYSNVPLNIYTDYNFRLLPMLNSSGVPVNMYYQPFSDYGTINLWPKPPDNTTSITIRYQRPFEDMVTATDDFDFPPYWLEAIIYNLADRLAPEYGIPLQDRSALKMEAKMFKDEALSFGSEEGSLYLQPDWSGRF